MSQNTNSSPMDPAITRCRYFGSNFNLCDIDPASQYIKLKLIQNTVRVPASLYMHDLGALTVYQTPLAINGGVNWNQMSDRAVRHVQPNIVAGGSFYHASSTKSTITRCRPGAGCPGGAGVDIKHNSYDRYLNRIKGKGPVRRGVVPPKFGTPYPFIPAVPVYGGKTMKTSIVGDNCGCPINKNSENSLNSEIYRILVNPSLFNNPIKFQVGSVVYALNLQNYYARAVVTAIVGDLYTVQFDDGTTTTTTNSQLFIYFPCNCNYINPGALGIDSYGSLINADSSNTTAECFIVNNFLGANSVYNTIYFIRNLLPVQFQKFLSYYNT